MKAPSQNLFPVAMMALLAALTFWLDHTTRIETGGNGKLRHDPDFFVQDYTAKQFGPDGKLKNLLVGKKMVHYPDDDSTDVTAPDLTSFGGVRPLHLRSRTATVSKDGKMVTLKDDVFGWRDATPDRAKITFATSRLIAYPDQDIADTDAPVTITQGPSVISGVGLSVDNKLRLLTLKSHVRGTVQPRK